MASGGNVIYKPVQVAVYNEEIKISEPCDSSCPIIDWAVVAFVDENELSKTEIARFFDWLVKRLRRQAKLVGSMLNFGEKPKAIWYSDQTYQAAKHVYIDLMQSIRSLSVIFHILPTVETPIYDWVKNITYKLNVCRQGVIADNVRSFFEAADAPLAEIIPNMAKNILQRSHQARNNDLRYNSESFQISRPNSTFMFPNANRAKSVMLFDADELPSGPYRQWDAPGLMRRNPQPYIAQHVPQMMMPSTSYAVMSIPSFFPPTTILDGEGFQIPTMVPPMMPKRRNTDRFMDGMNRSMKQTLPFASPLRNEFESSSNVQRFAQHKYPVRFNPMNTNRPAQRQARRASLPAIPEDIFDDDNFEDGQNLDAVLPFESTHRIYGKFGARSRGRGFYRGRIGMQRHNFNDGSAVMQRVINERMKDLDIQHQKHQRGRGKLIEVKSRGGFHRLQTFSAAPGSSGFRWSFDNSKEFSKSPANDLRTIYSDENIVERAALICNYPAGYNTKELQSWLASMGINVENVELFNEDDIPMACVVFASPEDAIQTKQKFHCHLRCGNALMEVYLLHGENIANVHGSVLQAMQHFIECFGGSAAENFMESSGAGAANDLTENSQETLRVINETEDYDEIDALNAELGIDDDEIKLEPVADFE